VDAFDAFWELPGLQADKRTVWSYDFSGVAGPLPSPWEGTWQLDGSGHAVPVVSEGAELFTDSGLEATYTGGLCDSLVAAGTPTVAQSGDVHGGSKAQQFAGTAYLDAVSQTNNLTAARWYAQRQWSKRTAGINGNVVFAWWDNSSFIGRAITAASYTQIGMAALLWATSLETFVSRQQGGGASDTVIADDVEVKQLSDTAALIDTGSAYGRISVKLTGDAYYPLGLVLNYTDEDNCDYVFLDRAGKVQRVKVVAGVVTVVASYAITYAAGTALIVTRHQNGTLDISYNGTSLVTGSAASGLTGTQWGLIGTLNTQTFDDFSFTTVGVT
jgi:hypothetical protein